MANAVGKGFQYGLQGAGTITFTPHAQSEIVSGWVLPGLRSWTLNHTVDFNEDRNQAGVVDAASINELYLSWSIQFALKGSSLANATSSGGFPQAGRFVTIANAPVIRVGEFLDAYNSANWMYIGDGVHNGVHDGIWTGSMTLRRYCGSGALSAGNFIT